MMYFCTYVCLGVAGLEPFNSSSNIVIAMTLLHISQIHVNTIPLPFSFCFNRACVYLFSLLFDFRDCIYTCSLSFDSYFVVKSLKSSEQFGNSGRIQGGNNSRISHSWKDLRRKSLKGYRSMLNLHVILVGLADHARLVNTYILSLD